MDSQHALRECNVTNLKNVTTYLERLSQVRVLCVGDVMLDRFVYGQVSRISPEAPVAVLRVERRASMLGGVGNVVRNLCSLGCKVTLAAATGQDDTAGEIRLLLNDLPNCRAVLASEAGRRTPVKQRFVANNQQLLRVDEESTHELREATLETLLQAFRAAAPQCEVVVLSDYAKGTLSGANAQKFVTEAVRAGKPVVVDPKGHDFRRYRSATVLKPNLKELAEASNMPVDSVGGVAAAARKLLFEAEAQWLVVTRGAAGMCLFAANGSSWSLPSVAREVFDVSGAGDTVAAVLAAAFGAGAPMEDAVYLANIAAGLVVAKVGTAVVSRQELMQECQGRLALGHHTGFEAVEIPK